MFDINTLHTLLMKEQFTQARLFVQTLPQPKQDVWHCWCTFYEKGATHAAEECWELILEAKSRNGDLWGAYGYFLWETQHPVKALAAFKKSISLGCDRSTLFNAMTLAVELKELSFAEECVAELETVIINQSNEDQPLSEEEWGIFLLCKAQLAREQQNPTEALQFLNSIQSPGPEVFLLKGHIFRDESLYTQSMMAYQEGLEHFDMHPDLLHSFKAVLPYIPSIPSGVHSLLSAQPDSSQALAQVRGYLEKIQGDLLQRDSESAEVQHLKAALFGRNTPGPPEGYVEELFDDYADRFDSHLIEKLHYQVPTLIDGVIRNRFSNEHPADIVWDLGCGTGLLGRKISDLSKRLIGVDLSRKMLNRAEATDCYHALHHCDILHFLESSVESDVPSVVLIADTLVYLGDLRLIFRALSQRISNCTHVVFTLEAMLEHSEEGYQLMPTGRYTHDVQVVSEWLEEFGMTLMKVGSVDLRQGGGRWVKGWLCIAQLKG